MRGVRWLLGVLLVLVMLGSLVSPVSAWGGPTHYSIVKKVDDKSGLPWQVYQYKTDYINVKLVNYTAPFYTSHNLTVEVELTVCSGIGLFEPNYNGMKYRGCRVDRIVASGKGWIIGKGFTKIDMWFRKHWYDL